MSTINGPDPFDPFDDEPIATSSEVDDGGVIGEEVVKVQAYASKEARVENEELYDLIDATPREIQPSELTEHAELVIEQSESNETTSVKPIFSNVKGYSSLSKILHSALVEAHQASLERSEKNENALHKVEVLTYRASKPYRVTANTNQTYLYAIQFNEVVKYNFCTATLDGDNLVQLEVLPRAFKPDSSLRYPLLGFLDTLLSKIEAGGVYMMGSQPILLINGHAAPIFAREMTMELSLLNGASHIRLLDKQW